MPEKKRKTRVLRRVAPGSETQAEQLRVLMLSVTGELGGAERSFLEVLRALPKERIDPRVCVPPETELAKLCEHAGVPVSTVALRRFRRTANPFLLAGQVKALYKGSLAISEICADEKISLICANTDSAALVAWEASRIAKVPFVWHSRDLIPMHGFARILSSSAAAVVAISQTVEAHLLREGVSREKLRRIDNGVELSRIPSPQDRAGVRERVRRALEIGADRPVVLCVGSFVPWKKLDVFIDTMAALRMRMPNIVGLLVGSDLLSQNEVYVEILRDRAKALLLDGDSLRFLGERDDVPELMAAADVLISCSENEPFGRVVAEAGAAGLPVVSTRSGGKVEIVEDNVTGLLTEPGNAAELSNASARLLQDDKLRRDFGAAARLRVEQKFDVRRTAEEMASLFESVVNKSE